MTSVWDGLGVGPDEVLKVGPLGPWTYFLLQNFMLHTLGVDFLGAMENWGLHHNGIPQQMWTVGFQQLSIKINQEEPMVSTTKMNMGQSWRLGTTQEFVFSFQHQLSPYMPDHAESHWQSYCIKFDFTGSRIKTSGCKKKHNSPTWNNWGFRLSPLPLTAHDLSSHVVVAQFKFKKHQPEISLLWSKVCALESAAPLHNLAPHHACNRGLQALRTGSRHLLKVCAGLGQGARPWGAIHPERRVIHVGITMS